MLDAPATLYKCLAQLTLLTEFALQDGETLGKLYGQLNSTVLIDEPTEDTYQNYLIKLMRYYDRGHTADYN